MRGDAAFGAVLGAILAASASAQEVADPARLDEFALPAAEGGQRPEQITAREASPVIEQRVDRSLAPPQTGERSAVEPVQLSGAGEGGAVSQLGSRQQSAPAPGMAVSTTRDSAPGGVARIGGEDRCDPQLIQRLYAQCLRILELRSGEFAAPEPAALSAEQRLLAEQRQREEMLARSSAALRLRYATAVEPDADLQSNQELASIYLDPATAPEPAQPAQSEEDARLGEVLKGFGIETVPSPPPPGS